jgi:hypothetical protein
MKAKINTKLVGSVMFLLFEYRLSLVYFEAENTNKNK